VGFPSYIRTAITLQRESADQRDRPTIEDLPEHGLLGDGLGSITSLRAAATALVGIRDCNWGGGELVDHPAFDADFLREYIT
jgi:hypothetical protein